MDTVLLTKNLRTPPQTTIKFAGALSGNRKRNVSAGIMLNWLHNYATAQTGPFIDSNLSVNPVLHEAVIISLSLA
jgi:hypothetical protein